MTPLQLVLTALGLLAAAALLAGLSGRSDRAALWGGTIGILAASALGVVAGILALVSGEETALRMGWSLPLGELHLGLDRLSAFFVVGIFTVGGLAAFYGAGYLQAYFGRRAVAPAMVFFAVLLGAMALLVLARDGVLFLIGWELMSLSSFFLVTFEREREEVRRAGLTYLIASQLGVVFIFIVFALLARGTGSFDFDGFAGSAASSGVANTCFVLAMIGFGAKAGFWPMHIWLPDAHPAAPSHVSAVMSGVMVKLGIYGLIRIVSFLGTPPAWWGLTLIGIGVVSGVAGVAHALAQRDIKRMLAYSTVENVGIIVLALGLGMLGTSQGDARVAMLGYAGALLHILNHGLFKGLLFQTAGSVVHATGVRQMDAFGGLSRRMPLTAGAFLLGSVAICGLPPLNGFVGEWLIYVGAFRGAASLSSGAGIAAMAAIPALALIGGLALACFVKAYGVVFQGEPRTGAGAHAHEPPAAMRAAMLAGASACVAIGAWPAGVVMLVGPVASTLAGTSLDPSTAFEALAPISRIAAALALVVAVLVIVRVLLLRGRPIGSGATWGCGYAAPTPRMQYTGDSFAEPLLGVFAPVVKGRIERDGPEGPFPQKAHHRESLADMAGERLLIPASRMVLRSLSRLRILQHGRVHLYLAYIFATLIAVLIWQLGGGR